MIVVIDNYDSFTYNIVQAIGMMGRSVDVVRNDAIDIAGVEALRPTHLIVSPGPSTPLDAGISIDIVRYFQGRIPIFGVCLGHQVIVAAYGGNVVRAERPMHGKTSWVHHDGQTLFDRLPSPLRATRYHSLIAQKETVPPSLSVTAYTEHGEVMAVRHRQFPIEGVQFHPESIMTEHGAMMIHQFITYYEGVYDDNA